MTEPSDLFFTPAVKAVRFRRGSRDAYARMAAARGFQTTITPDLEAYLAEREPRCGPLDPVERKGSKAKSFLKVDQHKARLVERRGLFGAPFMASNVIGAGIGQNSWTRWRTSRCSAFLAATLVRLRSA